MNKLRILTRKMYDAKLAFGWLLAETVCRYKYLYKKEG